MIDKETNDFLMRQGPTFHMSLFHHHQITAKINEIEEPADDELITFELAEGEYSIFYRKLKEFAAAEQAKFIQQNDNNAERME